MNDRFIFRDFTIYQDRCGMKVGTDSVLLGAWAKSPDAIPRSILDVGAGTGVLSLMMAQRFPESSVRGVEIDHDAFLQASENIGASRFCARVEILECDFRFFPSDSKYDIIVSNPPFFGEDRRTKAMSASNDKNGRYTARHLDSLSFEDLIDGVGRMLSEEGCFSVVLPYGTAFYFIGLCAERDLFLTHRCNIKDSPEKTFKRSLMTFSRRIVPTISSALSVRDESGACSSEFRSLTEAFYLPAVFE